MKIRVKEVKHETTHAVTLVLNWPVHMPYRAGQFIQVSLDDNSPARSYSFSSAPHEPETTITVKRVDGGLMSNRLNDIKPYTFIHVSQPKGSFTLKKSTAPTHHVMLAAGSGITPIFSLIKDILHQQSNDRISLLYANTQADSIIFHDQLLFLQQQYEPRFQIVHVVDDPSTLAKAIQGPLTIPKLMKQLTKLLIPAIHLPTHYWICGPAGYMHMARETLDLMKVSAAQISIEAFDGNNNLNTQFPQKKEEFLLKIQQGDKVKYYVISNQEYVLPQLLQQAFAAPHSCLAASCGTCKVKVLSGEITLDKNYILTEEELLSGMRLLCKGRINEEVMITYENYTNE